MPKSLPSIALLSFLVACSTDAERLEPGHASDAAASSLPSGEGVSGEADGGGGIAMPPAEPPPPTVELPPGAPLHALWDGASGATRDYWNRGLRIPWAKSLGDWTDAAGAAHGTAAFATIAAVTGTTSTTDVTSLVREWIGSGNTGAYLRSTQGTVRFASREATASAEHPKLVVVTDAGEVEAPIVADAMLDGSTSKALGTQATFRVGGGSGAVLQFDLSKVVGNVVSATLSLHSTDGTGKIAVYRVDPPKAWRGDGGTVELGIAAAYPYDQGLAAHADVLYAHDFSPGYEQYFGNKAWSHPVEIVDEPELKSKSARNYFADTVGSCALSHRFTSNAEPEPHELYFRYYVLLEDDWGSTVDGNKMPGLAGRYGDWNGRYWNPVCGNGGARTDGRVHENGVRCGWTLRGHQPAPEVSDANPYRELSPVGTYAYHPDQAGSFGDGWRWGIASGVGYPVLEHGRWYSIEQYVKLNTISGPLDALGNGTGDKNAVFRVWINGVRVYDRTSFRLRHNDAIKIDDVWLNWYHGGTEPPAPGAKHHYRMSNLVVARKYIGPLARTP